MSNAKRLDLGNATERKVCDFLAQHGWWATRLSKSQNGSQPCDVVALKEERSLLLDGKHCEKGYLPTGRIESNQITCFTLASQKGIKCGFACEYNGILYYIDWSEIDLNKPAQQLERRLEDEDYVL